MAGCLKHWLLVAFVWRLTDRVWHESLVGRQRDADLSLAGFYLVAGGSPSQLWRLGLGSVSFADLAPSVVGWWLAAGGSLADRWLVVVFWLLGLLNARTLGFYRGRDARIFEWPRF